MDRLDRMFVMRDDVVLPQKDIQLERFQPAGVVAAESDGVQDEIHVLVPIVHLGHVRFLQRVVHRQGMESEGACENRFVFLRRVAFEIHP
jgi:hypothetical protein